MNWQPRYTITPEIARSLMQIEAARAVVARTHVSLAAQEEMRRAARLRSTHFSTRIEGNRLTLAEAEQVIGRRPALIAGRERDVREVQCYWDARIRVDEWAEAGRALTSDMLRQLHGMVERGRRARPTPFRDGQNAIRESASGRLVYLPPMARDVPVLIEELVDWCAGAERSRVPAPLAAGLAHYQFATIHPFYDGNGRTARLLAAFLLHGAGYGLNGIYSLEEEHARDTSAYYSALATHPHHNYYEGRADADLTGWLVYFTGALSRVIELAEAAALRISASGARATEGLEALDARTRRIVALFSRTGNVVSRNVAVELGISDRAARTVLAVLVERGVVVVTNSSNRARAYALSEVYRKFIGS